MALPSVHGRNAGLAARRRALLAAILAGCTVLATACGSNGSGSAASSSPSGSAVVSSTVPSPSASTAGASDSSAAPETGEVEKVEVSGIAAPSTVEPVVTSTASSQAVPSSEAIPSSEAVPSSEASTSNSAPPPSAVAQVVDGACASAPASGQPATSTGAVPVEAFVCDFAGTAPGATVTFLKWASVDDAFSYYRDAAGLGPRIENYDKWTVNGVDQGPLWTNAPGDRTLSTGAYNAVPYTWQISTATLDDSNAVFGKVTFKPASTLS